MRFAPATKFAAQKSETEPLIKEQRFLLPPPNAKDIKQFYDINTLLKAANYLVGVEDRAIPVAFFAEPRYGFKTIVQFLQQLRNWKSQGYTNILMIHGADPLVGMNQPYGKYYVWEHRLKTMKYLEPVK